MNLYVRGNAARIEWGPPDEAAAKTAIENVIGESPSEYPVEVSAEVAEEIRAEYDELTVDTT